MSKLQPGGIYVETTDVAAPSTETISVNVPVVPITTQIPAEYTIIQTKETSMEVLDEEANLMSFDTLETPGSVKLSWIQIKWTFAQWPRIIRILAKKFFFPLKYSKCQTTPNISWF